MWRCNKCKYFNFVVANNCCEVKCKLGLTRDFKINNHNMKMCECDRFKYYKRSDYFKGDLK